MEDLSMDKLAFDVECSPDLVSSLFRKSFQMYAQSMLLNSIPPRRLSKTPKNRPMSCKKVPNGFPNRTIKAEDR